MRLINAHEQWCHPDTSTVITVYKALCGLHTLSKIPYFYPSFTDTSKESGIKWRPTHVIDTFLQKEKCIIIQLYTYKFKLCCMPELHGSCEVVCCVPGATASRSSLHYSLEKCLP